MLFENRKLSVILAAASCVVALFSEGACSANKMRLSVVVASPPTAVTLDVEPNASVANLKRSIYERTGVSPSHQLLVHEDSCLEDGLTLASYGIRTESRVHLVVVDDLDVDGVHEGEDSCAATGEGESVDDAGCSIAQYCPCAGPTNEDPTNVGANEWNSHAHYLACVETRANSFVEKGHFAPSARSSLLAVAAQATCGK